MFSAHARNVLTLASDEAAPDGGVVGTSHLLLALMREESGIASDVLVELGVSLAALRRACAEAGTEPAGSKFGALQLSAPAKRLLARAGEESVLTGGGQVDTGHLLLALAHDRDCGAMRALAALGVDAGVLRTKVRNSTKSEPAEARAGTVGFDKFTDGAKHALNQARAEAQRFDHDTLSTGHVLLGLLHSRSGTAATILANVLVRADDVRVALTKVTKETRTGRATRALPFSAQAKKLLENALIHARALGSSEFGSEHLLLGLLEDRDSDACRGLTGIGVEVDGVRDAALRWVKRERGEP